MLVTGNVSPRTRRRTDHTPRGLRSVTQIKRVTSTKVAPFRSPPRDVYFSIEKTIPHGDHEVRTRPNSRQNADTMQDYFPSVSTEQASRPNSKAQPRCESVPITNTDPANLDSTDVDATRSSTAPPNIDLSLKLSDLENLNMRADDVATVAIEKEQQKFHTERRLNISSAMGVRQHGSPRYASLSGTPTGRRKRREREHAYLCMKFRERPCVRTESFLNDDLYDRVNNMSRECCDVLGPKACHECDRLNRRSNSALRNEANFPSIHISAANFSTMTIVNRVRPELNSRQVLERLAQGDISRQSFSRQRTSSDEKRQEQDSEVDRPARRKKTSVSAFTVPDGLGFFTNFTDLTAQIFAKKRGERSGRPRHFNQGVGDSSNLPAITDVELVPKKEWERENPANYFGPPMLTRAEIERQKSHPRFYAGAGAKYELPEAPSFDEIAFQASGARHKRIRQLEARSDTPDSEISLFSVKSSHKDDEQSVAPSETETNTVSEDTDAKTTVQDLDNNLEVEPDSS
ncbi:uncharacterized protein LOC119722826 [Patiria miniata]|uniref:Uncharacterized protein n=1 Tax=Patiria miniata TaxID=46514 RepID=A0A913ZDI1_PATMI|nr:uncharacterized protein LOC119722826 [Patiria miniata]